MEPYYRATSIYALNSYFVKKKNTTAYTAFFKTLTGIGENNGICFNQFVFKGKSDMISLQIGKQFCEIFYSCSRAFSFRLCRSGRFNLGRVPC